MKEFDESKRLVLKGIAVSVAFAMFPNVAYSSLALGSHEVTKDDIPPFPKYSKEDKLEDAKLSLAFALHYIPFVGNILSFLVHVLWPSPHEDVWAEIREQVAQLIDEKIAQDVFSRLQQVLAGLESVLKTYLQATKVGVTDQELLNYFITSNLFFVNQRPWFQQEGHEYALSPLFAAFTLLHMTLLRDGLINHKHIFSDNEYANLKSNMKEYAKDYSEYLEKVYKEQLDELQKNAPHNAGPHNTAIHNHYANYNALKTKFCDDYVESMRQMDIDLNPVANFEMDKTKFKDVFSPAYGTADDFDYMCERYATRNQGVQEVFSQPLAGFTDVFIDFFDRRPRNLVLTYPQGMGPKVNGGSRKDKVNTVIASYVKGVEESNFPPLAPIEDDAQPYTHALVVVGSYPLSLVLKDFNEGTHHMWRQRDDGGVEVDVGAHPRRLTSFTCYSRSHYFHDCIGSIILGFTWAPPKNQSEESMKRHMITSLDEPDPTELSDIHEMDASTTLTSEDYAARDQYWEWVAEAAARPIPIVEGDDDTTDDGDGGSLGVGTLVGLGVASLIKNRE